VNTDDRVLESNEGDGKHEQDDDSHGPLMAWCGALGAALWLAGCAVTDVGRAPQMSPGDVVAVLPIVNNTETPQAGLRAEAIAESLLKTGGVANLKRYPPR
jgi:hypothetical protein